MDKWEIRKIKRDLKRDILVKSNSTDLNRVLYLVEDYERILEDRINLKNENHILKERLENYIPRRRVRRVYKQLHKILTQDEIVDDLEETNE